MTRALKFLAIIFILSVGQLKAGHIMGAQITYKHLGNLQYEITYKFYRDCRGIPFSSPTVSMYGTAGTKTLSKSLSMIRDVSNFCKTSKNPCNPQNQTISGTNPAVEEHVYLGYVDFNKADSAFKKSCNILFGAGQCCRSGAITTGAAGNDFWVITELNLCAAPNNSSPVFSNNPNNILCCNQPVFLNVGAIDSLDHDSLSYEFTDPMTSYTGKVSWGGSRSAVDPFTNYWPTGYDKKKGPNPSVNPPIGTFLDPETGNLIFTPLDCSEVTIMALKVSEWRKDTSGKYIKIGSTTRDVQFIIISCPDNNPPQITNKTFKFSVCAGTQICFDITSDDKQFKTNPPDTVDLYWNGAIKEASFKIKDTTARLKKAQFCWSTQKSNAHDLPYHFNVTARDNICPMNGIAMMDFSILVKQNAEATWTKTYIKNGLYALKVSPKSGFKGSPSYNLEILDSTLKPVDSLAAFSSNGYSRSTKPIDSIQFYKGGRYILLIGINNQTNCPTFYYDTIKVAAVTPILKVYPRLPFNKTVCKGSMDSIYPTFINAKSPIKFRWSTSKTDTLPYLKFKITKDTTIRVDVYDGAGYKRSASWIYSTFKDPTIKMNRDTLVCENTSVPLGAQVTNYKDTVYWNWYYQGKYISSLKNPNVTKKGFYVLEAMDSNQCPGTRDSMQVKNWMVIANAGADITECLLNNVTLKAKGLDLSNGKKGNYSWYVNEVKGSPVSVNDSLVHQLQKNTSIILKLIATDGSLECTDFDTVKLIGRALPAVLMKDGEICQNELDLNLHTLIVIPINTRTGTIKWELLKTLPKPNGTPNKLADLVYDKDPTLNVLYHLKGDSNSIDLGSKWLDTLRLKFSFEDPFGCVNSDTTSILIKKVHDIQFKSNPLAFCQGDSILTLSKKIGPDYSGGKWYTNNDSSQFKDWPQGHKVLLNEQLATNNLDVSGGDYLLNYHMGANFCNSNKNAVLTLYAAPIIKWSQTEKGDSLILTETSTNTNRREWYVNSNKISDKSAVTVAKALVKTSVFVLKVFNKVCDKDSLIVPKITWGLGKMESNFITISPNPAHNSMLIKSNLVPPLELKITNQLGQTIITQMLIKTEEMIDISNLSKGIYFIEVKANENVGRVKFVKE